MRTLLLLAAVSVGLLLHQTHRAYRLAWVPPPAPERPSDAAPPAGASVPSPHREPLPSAPSAEEETPLSAMDREVLREATEEWRLPDAGLLERPLPPEEARTVAIAVFRGALREAAEGRVATEDAHLPRVRASLRGKGTIELVDLRFREDRIAGALADGRTIEIPAAAVFALEETDAESAEAARRRATEERIAALAAGGADERTVAIELLLRQGELPRAEEMFASWITSGGPAALAASAEDAARRALLDLALRRWTAPAPAASERGVGTGSPAVRNLETLSAFLAAAAPSRELGSADRVRLAEECSAWSDWLAAHADRLRIPAGERHGLEQRLRLLRYDLLKGTGF